MLSILCVIVMFIFEVAADKKACNTYLDEWLLVRLPEQLAAKRLKLDTECYTLPQVITSGPCTLPERKILDDSVMSEWQESEAYARLVEFMITVSSAITSSSLRPTEQHHPSISGVLTLLEAIDKLIEEVDIIDQPQRFGNVAFRTWWHRLNEVSSFDYP